MRLLALLLFASMSNTLFAEEKPAISNRSIAFRNVTLIDMVRDKPQHGVTIIVSGNRISGIGKRLKIPKNTEVIDATGKYIIPGLWDNYTFTLEAVKNELPYFELMLGHGITGVRDVGTSMDLREAADLRADINSGRKLGPRLFYAGPVLLAKIPPRRSIRWTVNSKIVTSPEEAKQAVAALADAGVDHIKAEKRTPPELLREIIRAAHQHKLRVVAVPPSYIAEASDDGLDCVEHAAEIFRATSNKRDEYYSLYRDGKIDSMTMDENYEFFGTMKPDAPYYMRTLNSLAKNKTCVVTNASHTDTFVGDFELRDSSRHRFKTSAQMKQLKAKVTERERQLGNRDYRTSQDNRKRHLREIMDLHKAGVLLLAGTQTNPVGVGTPGLMLHDELALFVQAGLTPFEALKTATVNPAKLMRREREMGTVERGKLADFVLLNRNPLEAISNTRMIEGVVANGHYLSRTKLDQLLTTAETYAKNH